MKRPLDVLVAALGLAVLAPLALVVGLAVAARIGRPVLFTQTRPGRGSRLFRMYKFRTMTDARDAIGELLPDARRLTRLGRALRAFSLDELPELWTVLLTFYKVLRREGISAAGEATIEKFKGQEGQC